MADTRMVLNSNLQTERTTKRATGLEFPRRFTDGKVHPFDAVEWEPVPGISDQWRLENSESLHRGENFLAVTEHGLFTQMQPQFAELTLLKTIEIHTGPGGGKTYTLYIARGYRGPEPL